MQLPMQTMTEKEAVTFDRQEKQYLVCHSDLKIWSKKRKISPVFLQW
jgi:hypothetical protein